MSAVVGRTQLPDRADASVPSGRVIGLDLGGTKLLAAVRDLESETTSPAMRTLVHATDVDGLVDQIVGTCADLIEEHGVVDAVGLGVVGVPDLASGRLLEAPNLPGVGSAPFLHLVEERLGVPLAVENDVNAAALGEFALRGRRTDDSFAFIALGTGIGMGLVADGRLWRGATGRAGEIAFLPFGTDPLLAENRVRGPFEEAVGGLGLSERYRRLGGQANNGAANVDIIALAEAGDIAASAALDHLADELARGVVAIRAVVDPAEFVFGGGLGAHDAVIMRIVERLAAYGAEDTRISMSRAGDTGGLLGAIELAADTARHAATLSTTSTTTIRSTL